VLLFIGRGCYCKCTDAGVGIHAIWKIAWQPLIRGERRAIWSSWMAEMRLFTLISLVPNARLKPDSNQNHQTTTNITHDRFDTQLSDIFWLGSRGGARWDLLDLMDEHCGTETFGLINISSVEFVYGDSGGIFL
jgi:hypothetical protein